MQEARFRAIFRRAHAGHAGCAQDEWLVRPCPGDDGHAPPRPLIWSRRNGAWRQVDVVWVGAAPGNAGGMGGGDMGAHATGIPFGGDVAGGNLDTLLSSIGLDRNRTFIAASLNRLPDRGGGEPRVAELLEPVGDYPTSLHLLRDTLLAAGPRLVVALGNVALRCTVAAGGLGERGRLALPSLARLRRRALARAQVADWPAAFAVDASFLATWRERWSRPPPRLLWLLHPSAQNMSPYAGASTVFHARMLETRHALRRAVREALGWSPPAERSAPPEDGIYALPAWRQRVGPRHAELDRLWRARGV